MKDGFVLLTNLDEKHNEVHRKAFFSPETFSISSKLPNIDNLQLGEFRVYSDGTDFWLYCKLSRTQIGRIKFTIV